MELQDTIFKRQSVRKFKNQDVSDEDILKMIKATGADTIRQEYSKLAFCCYKTP